MRSKNKYVKVLAETSLFLAVAFVIVFSGNILKAIVTTKGVNIEYIGETSIWDLILISIIYIVSLIKKRVSHYK